MDIKTSFALLVCAAALSGLATCAAPGQPAQASVTPAGAQAPAPVFDAIAPSIRAGSCAAHAGDPAAFSDIDFSARALTPAQSEAVAKRLPATARFAGGWELTSADPNFGGLSGLALTEGDLLAITDSGGWVRIGFGAAGAPASAAIAYKKGEDGRFLSGKSQNDAEGLAWREGLAFVSYEHGFRIEGYDLAGCGAEARAVRVADLPDTFGGKAIDPNAGPEALALTPGGALLFGYEGADDSTSPIGEVLADGTSRWTGRLAGNPKGFALVSLDSVRLPSGENREIALYRAFDPLRGARSVLVWGAGEDQRLTLSRPVLTDNFEGLAAEVMETGELRLWIVSDNNFNKVQRTLLYAFDVAP